VIVLDTTVLVYALGADHPLRGPVRALLEAAHDEVVRLTTTVEVIQEFAHVVARRRGRKEAVVRAKDYLVGLSPLAQPEEGDLLEGLGIFGRLDSLGSFDSVLAAMALRRNWALASADRAFSRVEGLLHLDPSSSRFVEDARSLG
jgi:predicted nucleic acid-binding protein